MRPSTLEMMRHVPLEDGHVPLEDGHVPLEDGHVPLEDGHVPLEDGHVPLEDGHASLCLCMEVFGGWGNEPINVRSMMPKKTKLTSNDVTSTIFMYSCLSICSNNQLLGLLVVVLCIPTLYRCSNIHNVVRHS